MSLDRYGLAKQYPDRPQEREDHIVARLCRRMGQSKLLLLLGAVTFVLFDRVRERGEPADGSRRRPAEGACHSRGVGAGRWRIVRQLLDEQHVVVDWPVELQEWRWPNWGVKILLATSVMNEF